MDLKHLLRLKSTGHSNREISQILGRSRNTINDYVNLFGKSGKDFASLSQLDLSSLYRLLGQLKGNQIPIKDTRYAHLEDHKQTYLNDLKRKRAAKYRLIKCSDLI